MKKIVAALLAMLMAATIVLGTPRAAEAVPGCLITVLNVRVCGELLNQPLPEVVEVTVTAPPVRVPVPGPTRTVTVPAAPVTETVTRPAAPAPSALPSSGPTQTVTVSPSRETVTSQPSSRPSAQPSQLPAQTVTESPQAAAAPSASAPIGQDSGGSGRIDREPDSGFFSPDVDLDDGEVTVGEVGLGTLALLGLTALVLLAMYAGYVLGYKDKERKDTSFMRALLEQSRLRRR